MFKKEVDEIHQAALELSGVNIFLESAAKKDKKLYYIITYLLERLIQDCKNHSKGELTDEEFSKIRQNILSVIFDPNMGERSLRKVKTLFISSNPKSTTKLNIEEEVREITEKIRGAEFRDSIDFIAALAARPSDLLQMFNQHTPQIVHFSGHGAESGELLLIDNKDSSKFVSIEDIVELFSVMKDNIKLVFLNACHSKEQAQALSNVIDCAIGMDGTISDAAAIAFAAAFYRAIGFNRSIENSFDQGKVALRFEGLSDQCSPQLFVRDGVDPSMISLLS